MKPTSQDLFLQVCFYNQLPAHALHSTNSFSMLINPRFRIEYKLTIISKIIGYYMSMSQGRFTRRISYAPNLNES